MGSRFLSFSEQWGLCTAAAELQSKSAWANKPSGPFRKQSSPLRSLFLLRRASNLGPSVLVKISACPRRPFVGSVQKPRAPKKVFLAWTKV